MRTIIAALLSLGLASAALAAPEDDGVIRIGGSTTLLPSVASIASDYMEKFKTWDKIDPSLPKKEIVVFVSGGGSGFGVKGAMNGTVHIGLVSRDLKPEEKIALGDYKTWLVGKDAVAFVARKDSPLGKARKSFTADQIAGILSGEKARPSAFDPTLPDQPLAVFVRDSGAGSAEIIQGMILKHRQVAKNALQMPSQGALLKKLETTRNGFGYLSSGLALASPALTTFALDGVAPTNDNVISGKYPLARPLLLVVKGAPGPLVSRFVRYMMAEGQAAIAAHDLVPTTSVASTAR
jgi:phosphate transport system substrate-binding protein